MAATIAAFMGWWGKQVGGVSAWLGLILMWAGPALASHGGSFSIDYKAANPALYGPAFPSSTACPGGERVSNPLPDAQHATGVESLTPDDMELGQIVAFEFEIAVSSTAPAGSSIQFTGGWETVTSPASTFGYDGAFLIYCVFVDPADAAAAGGDTDASASVVSEALVGTEIQGTFLVSGLDPGETVVVEVWLVLDSSIPPDAQGNVQSRVVSASTVSPDVDTINTGAQTIPILQVQRFRQTAAIVVAKQVAAGSDQAQTFQFSGALTATLGHGQSATQAVEPGTYTVTEAVPSGWNQPAISCNDSDSSGSGATATYNAAGGETVTCTFTNSQAAVPTTATTGTTAATATTTAVPITPSTLPFTGRHEESVGVGLGLLVLGGLALLAARAAGSKKPRVPGDRRR